VAWWVSILPVRVLGCAGGSYNGTISDIVDGIRWAAGLFVDNVPTNSNPADIINLSLGGPRVCDEENDGELIEAIDDARRAGAVVVVAAGNGLWLDAQNRQCNRAAGGAVCKHICPGVVSVAASDKQGRLAKYSNFGAVTIMAPGGDTGPKYDAASADLVADPRTYCRDHTCYPSDGILSTVRAHYWWLQGTSMAAPHVSGAIVLALAKHPEWRRNPDLIEQALKASAVKPAAGACPTKKPCGSGQLDAKRLILSK
jgi:serine protease